MKNKRFKFPNNWFLFTILGILLCIDSSFTQQLTSIESAEYDSSQNRYLISNRTSIIARDAQGNLSTFGSGAIAEYAMEIVGNVLFTIAQSKVFGYDLVTGNQVAEITIPGVSFLNGMTHDDNNNLYVTDFRASKINKIDISNLNNPVVTDFVSNTNSSPNGIVFDKGNQRLVFVNWGTDVQIKAVDINTSNVTTLASTRLRNCDGIVMDKAGNFYISSWTPQRITQYDNQFSLAVTLTQANLNNPADLAYNSVDHEIGIPNSGNNTFTVIKLSPVNISLKNSNLTTNLLQLSDKGISLIQNKRENISLGLFDVNGQNMGWLYQGTMSAGKYYWQLSDFQIASGLYFLKYTRKTSKETFRILLP